MKNINANSGEADLRSIDKKDLRLAVEYSAMQKEVKKFLHTKVEHYMHFQNAAREDKHQRYNSTQLNKMLNSEFLSRIAGTNGSKGLRRELSILTDLRDSDGDHSSESGQAAKASQAVEKQLTTKANISEPPAIGRHDSDDDSMENTNQQIFKAQQRTQKFYKEQKAFYQNPAAELNVENEFLYALQEKHCLVMPAFAKIQDYELNLSNQFVNVETIAALSAYILDQTELLNEKVSKESYGNFAKA